MPRHPELALAVHSPFYGAFADDARGFSIAGCLAKSLTFFCRGVTPLVWVTMMPLRLELMVITLRTSLLHMKLGIQGHHKIEAHFDQDFSLFLVLFYFLLV